MGKLFDENMGSLNISVSEGSIDEIRVSGNKLTREGVILRELKFEEGDTFNISRLENALNNLRISDLYKEIDVEIYKEDTRNIIEVKVDEKIPT